MSARLVPEQVIRFSIKTPQFSLPFPPKEASQPVGSPAKSPKKEEEFPFLDAEHLNESIQKAVLTQVSQAKVDLAEMNATISRELNGKIERNASRIIELEGFCQKIMELVQNQEQSRGNSILEGSSLTEGLKEKIEEVEMKNSRTFSETQNMLRNIETKMEQELGKEDTARMMAIEDLERKHKEQMNRILEKALLELRSTWDERINGLVGQIVGRLSSVETKITASGLLTSTLEGFEQRNMTREQEEAMKSLENKFNEFADGFHFQVSQLQREIQQREKPETIFRIMRGEIKELLKIKADQKEIDVEIRPYFKQIIEGMNELTAGVEEAKRMANMIDKECCARAADLRIAIADSEKRSKMELLETIAVTQSQNVSAADLALMKRDQRPSSQMAPIEKSEIIHPGSDLVYSIASSSAEKRLPGKGTAAFQFNRQISQEKSDSFGQKQWQRGVSDHQLGGAVRTEEDEQIVSTFLTREFKEEEKSAIFRELAKILSKEGNPEIEEGMKNQNYVGYFGEKRPSESSEEFKIRQMLALSCSGHPPNQQSTLKPPSETLQKEVPKEEDNDFGRNLYQSEYFLEKTKENEKNTTNPSQLDGSFVEILIDEEGFLVDAEGKKLLDDLGVPIKLTNDQIKSLQAKNRYEEAS